MKSINLISLTTAKQNINRNLFNIYKKQFEISIKDNEISDLTKLVKQLTTKTNDFNIFNEYFIGYAIPQISKEFDLLRFGVDSVINIELKCNKELEDVRKQLIQNKYYLSFLNKEVINYTYLSSTDELFYLDNNNDLLKINFETLITKLSQQQLIKVYDIDSLFDPTNYLISPFNTPDKFINDNYFLTDQQFNIKKEIIHLRTDNPFGTHYIAIEGAAGTGKTLLTYDIAKEFMKQNINVVIFHCGTLNNSQENLNENYNWNIYPIKSCNKLDLCNFQVIIVDECQRIYKSQLENLLKDNFNCLFIFSYDPKQTLRESERLNNIPKLIENIPNIIHRKLTKKIRTNKEIASFIINLFNLSKKNPNIKYKNIEIEYFSNIKDAQNYLRSISNNWTIINYTPSLFDSYNYDLYKLHEIDKNPHNIIGQEFDNVVGIIDSFFYYRDDNLLTTKYCSYYHVTSMLFQILSRTRKKLKIIIIDNPEMLEKCLDILNIK